MRVSLLLHGVSSLRPFTRLQALLGSYDAGRGGLVSVGFVGGVRALYKGDGVPTILDYQYQGRQGS